MVVGCNAIGNRVKLGNQDVMCSCRLYIVNAVCCVLFRRSFFGMFLSWVKILNVLIVYSVRMK